MIITIEFFIFEWDYQISAEAGNFHFLDQTCPKRVFLAYNRCKEHHHRVLHIRINLSSKFFPAQINLNFWTKYAQKRYLGPKPKKVNIAIEFCIFELVQVPNFKINWQFWFLGPNLPKKGISSLKQIKWIKSLNSAYSN